jgi:hypothetical protein
MKEAIDAFDPATFGTSTHRAKASPKEVLGQLAGLAEALESLRLRIEAETKPRR